MIEFRELGICRLNQCARFGLGYHSGLMMDEGDLDSEFDSEFDSELDPELDSELDPALDPKLDPAVRADPGKLFRMPR